MPGLLLIVLFSKYLSAICMHQKFWLGLLPEAKLLQSRPGSPSAVVSTPSFVCYLLNTLWLVGKNAADYIHLAP